VLRHAVFSPGSIEEARGWKDFEKAADSGDVCTDQP
jgi:hypothetical protein